MKRIRVSLYFSILFSLVLVFHAYGATLYYNPGHISVTVEPGGEQTIPLTVSIPDILRGTYYVWFIDDSSAGAPPTSLVTAAPPSAFVSKYSPSGSTVLTVKVPEGTPPGTYSGILYSKAMAAHGIADPGTGMLLEIIVPSSCSKVPEFIISSFGPSYIWPPNHSMEKVTVSGNVVLAEGCSLINIGYTIDDEYGIYTSTGEFIVDENGSFTLYLPVEAWRNGNDKDGRHYTISLFAEDEAGKGTLGSLSVVVSHDQRYKQ